MKTLANDIWGANPTPSGSRGASQGKIYWGTSLEHVFSDQGIAQDFTFSAPKTISTYDYPVPRATDEIVCAHRHTTLADIYFVANQKVRTEGGHDILSPAKFQSCGIRRCWFKRHLYLCVQSKKQQQQREGR